MDIFDKKNYTNLNVYCFDLEQYNKNAKYLIVTVFLNFNGIMYDYDIRIWRHYYCDWVNEKWKLTKDLNEIKFLGLQYIHEMIRDEYL